MFDEVAAPGVVEDAAAAKLDVADLEKALARLPEHYRSASSFGTSTDSHGGGRGPLHISETAAKVRVHRGRKKLKEMVTERARHRWPNGNRRARRSGRAASYVKDRAARCRCAVILSRCPDCRKELVRYDSLVEMLGGLETRAVELLRTRVRGCGDPLARGASRRRQDARRSKPCPLLSGAASWSPEPQEPRCSSAAARVAAANPALFAPRSARRTDRRAKIVPVSRLDSSP